MPFLSDWISVKLTTISLSLCGEMVTHDLILVGGRKEEATDAQIAMESRVIASLLDLPIDQMTRLVSIWRLWFR